MSAFSFRMLDPARPGPFAQYLLPHALRGAQSEQTSFVLVGAVWEQYACGAAALELTGSKARLASLFVDPSIRRKGVARGLLLELEKEAAARGLSKLEVSYTLNSADLDAMDALFLHFGGEPFFYAPVFTMDSAQFHSSPLLGPTFRHDFQPNRHICLFSQLTPEQQQILEEEPPDYLTPSLCRDRLDPSLSPVWLEGDRPVAYVLGGGSPELGFALLAAWRQEGSPASSFLALLRTQLNLCYYQGGGDFLYHVSTVTNQTFALVERITGGVYTVREEHHVSLPLPFPQDRA